MTAIERFFLFIENQELRRTAIEKALGLSNGYLGKMKSRKASIGSDVIEKIILNFPNINANWLITGNGEMLLTDSKTSVGKKENETEETCPRIPLNAAIGSLSAILRDETDDRAEKMPIVRLFTRYDFTILINGDSMLPEFHPGDELACLCVKLSEFIQWGRVHVMDTDQGIIVKRIFDHDEYILCASENSGLYKDFKIRKSEIHQLALVIGILRRY